MGLYVGLLDRMTREGILIFAINYKLMAENVNNNK